MLNPESNANQFIFVKINQLKSLKDSQNSNESFLKAYKSHKRVAECLISNNLYRDSYFSLIIASECLLKGIFNSLKIHLFGTNENKMQTWILVESVHKHKEEFLPAKEFKHNLNKLTSTIKDLFYEFNKGDYINHYAQFTNAIDATIDWQNERYCDPEYRKKMNWEKKSIDLLEALNNLESTALKNLFGVQNDRY